MKRNQHPGAFPDEGDLALYAMGSLTAPDSVAVSDLLAQDGGLREELAGVELALGLYAEAMITIEAAPLSSRERLLRAIASRNVVVPFPSAPKVTAAGNATRYERPLRWAGWAIAAALLVATGMQYRHGRVLWQQISEQQARLRQAGTQVSQVARERDGLRDALERQVRQAEATRSEALEYKNRSAQLQSKVEGEAARAQRAAERADASMAVANATARERDQVRGTLATQQDMLAKLNTEAETARQIASALSDPSALRVGLTVPKQKKQPYGRGTYASRTGTLLFAASGLAPLGQGHVYELWLLPTDGSSPIPAGTFIPDASGNATVISGDFRKAISANGFAVTVEPSGGSLKPTSPILLAGQA